MSLSFFFLLSNDDGVKLAICTVFLLHPYQLRQFDLSVLLTYFIFSLFLSFIQFALLSFTHCTQRKKKYSTYICCPYQTFIIQYWTSLDTFRLQLKGISLSEAKSATKSAIRSSKFRIKEKSMDIWCRSKVPLRHGRKKSKELFETVRSSDLVTSLSSRVHKLAVVTQTHTKRLTGQSKFCVNYVYLFIIICLSTCVVLFYILFSFFFFLF